jgi:hypothetical protein
MAISRKFEIYVEKPQISTNEEIESHLTPFVRNCFPAHSVPRNIDDPFILGKDREKETTSKRIVYGIREMFVLHANLLMVGLEWNLHGRLWKPMDVCDDWQGE